ncbi:MAG: prepilin-type N-terminal cleavage/methylation domain-containing protein [Candidatus Omnitrophica bacterium]|nr:prepilin-type N-terminal cleavage/methylation domain-containing protein [Candidatus Omnitrophota bacterium]
MSRIGPCRRRAKTKGVSLIEVLISVAILAAGMAVILQGLVRSAYTLSVARNRLRAYSFASAKLTEVELGIHQRAELRPEGSFRIGRETFRWQLTVAPATPTTQEAALAVEWQQAGHPYRIHTASMMPIPATPEP